MNVAGLDHPRFDFSTYADRGCSWFASCLTCPLAKCRYDGGERETRAERRADALRLYQRGCSMAEIASALKTSRRTIHRDLSRLGS